VKVAVWAAVHHAVGAGHEKYIVKHGNSHLTRRNRNGFNHGFNWQNNADASDATTSQQQSWTNNIYFVS